MAINRKTIQKSTASMLLVWMWFNLLLTPSAALADELTDPTPTPEVITEQTTPAPEPTVVPISETTPEPTAEPAPTTEPDQIITTGDADAGAVSDTDVNNTNTTLPGDLTADDCSVSAELDCPDDITINTDNEASSSAQLDADAGSGDNSLEADGGDATIDTGDATATGLLSTTANTTQVTLADSATPSSTTETGITDITTPTPEPGANSLTVVNENQADVANDAEVSADTGGNAVEGNVDLASVDTGDATGLANVVNLLNTNIIGSGYQILSIDITGQDGEDIDLNQLWQQLLAINEDGDLTQLNWPYSPNVNITVINSNEANLVNNINVNANTGQNTAEGENGTIINTGDAVAAANVSNIVNTNIVGSKFVLGFINILPGSNVNLILPRSELFGLGTDGGIGGTGLDWFSYNLANIENNVTATANTGGNTGDGGSITTGDAVAAASTLTIANSNITMGDWFLLVLNNMGGWDGSVLGWNNPGQTSQAGIGSNIYQSGLPGAGDPAENTASIVNLNQADIENNISVEANTGGNTADGGGGKTEINTGNALAAANLFNLVNTNILGSNWFLGMVNVFGWGGKVIFAYPDVSITLTADRQIIQPGDIITYNLHYENNGYDTARGVRVNLDLPAGMTFVTDGGKQAGGCQQTVCSWDVGSLGRGGSGDITVRAKIKEDFDFDKHVSFWSKLLPSARAEDERKNKEVDVRATIATSDPDSDTSNNSFSVSGVVYEKLAGAGVDQRQPVLKIDAWNNVVDDVNPGDTVTFAITVKNPSEIVARNVKIINKLYDPEGMFLGSSMFEVGNLEAGKGGKISFGLTVPGNAGGGKYSTESYAVAEAVNGNNVVSEVVGTAFGVRTITAVTNGDEIALPAEPTGGQVLGMATDIGQACISRKQDIWIYIMLLLTSSVLLANRLNEGTALAYVLKKKTHI